MAEIVGNGPSYMHVGFTFNESALRFFQALSTRDQVQRGEVLDVAAKTIDGWLNACNNSPNCYDNNIRVRDVEKGQNGEYEIAEEAVEGKQLLNEHLPTLLRLSILCPFQDVLERATSILEELKEKGIKVPRRLCRSGSVFIPEKEVTPINVDDEQVQQLFIDAFIQNNRVDHITQIMGYHPHYLEAFLKTQQIMLRGDGPLPYDYRHYIALMAVGRHQCSYLINSQMQEFVLAGGNEEWLRGLDSVPRKLQDLYEINKILAHRPWLLTKSHIEKLTKGTDSWSVSELVHAIVLLAHFHSLSSFVHGCGINPEVDHVNGHTFRPPSISEEVDIASTSPTPSSPMEGEVEILMEKMKKLTEEQGTATQEEMIKRFENVERQVPELTSHDNVPPTPQADILRFVDDPQFQYQDFAKRGEAADIPTFRVQDYSWEEHGYSLLNRLYPDMGGYLDDKFGIAYELTYYTMGAKHDVDTTTLRRTIWNYIHCMFGIRHDDYDYGEVNQLLERSLKSYIKTVTCFPERTTKKDYDSFWRDFKHSEKAHVNLMIMEARMQAELLYALRAIMRYMT